MKQVIFCATLREGHMQNNIVFVCPAFISMFLKQISRHYPATIRLEF